MKSYSSRRQFLKRSLGATLAASVAPVFAPASALGREGGVAPSERIGVGCIGVGPQGRGVMGNFLAQPNAQVVALCDVAGVNLQAAQRQVRERYPNDPAHAHHDFRELLERTDVDAVLIATPDHWHVPVACAAADAGKDMYLEKPMGLSIAEDQILRKKIRDHKRIFQFGTQQRSSSQFRLACELVRNRRIGELRQINVWCSASRPGGTTAPVPVPAGLDYDRWLGPAPDSPYTVDKCFDEAEPGLWKTWWHMNDYALGFIAGWGVHPLDIAYWGYPTMMNAPFAVEGKGIIPTEGACNTPIAWDVRFRFATGVGLQYRGVRNGYDTSNALNDMSPWEQKYHRIIDHGTAFEGTDGWVLVDRSGIRTSPESLVETRFGSGDLQLPQSANHARDFLAAVTTRKPAICPIDDAVQADILCHLSDIAVRLERPLTWDPQAERFAGDRNANRRLRLRPVRKGWAWR